MVDSLYLLRTNFHRRKDWNKIKLGHVWANDDKGSWTVCSWGPNKGKTHLITRECRQALNGFFYVLCITEASNKANIVRHIIYSTHRGNIRVWVDSGSLLITPQSNKHTHIHTYPRAGPMGREPWPVRQGCCQGTCSCIRDSLSTSLEHSGGCWGLLSKHDQPCPWGLAGW